MPTLSMKVAWLTIQRSLITIYNDVKVCKTDITIAR
jgi:hypothetical protein